tara:strand:+ start:1401 stop:1769 length:369 start_codon:yes stop_codon:yes gene_type:complete
MSKIKYYKNINLEEFLDEDINENTSTIINKNYISDDLIMNENTIINKNDISDNFIINEDNSINIEIVETDDIESDISFEINKQSGEKKLILMVTIYELDEMLKLEFEIKKSTLKNLLKDLED